MGRRSGKCSETRSAVPHRGTGKYTGPITSVSLRVTAECREDIRTAVLKLDSYAKHRDKSGTAALIEVLNEALPDLAKVRANAKATS